MYRLKNQKSGFLRFQLIHPVSVLAYPIAVLAVFFYATDVADICDGFRIYVRRPSNERKKSGWGSRDGWVGRTMRMLCNVQNVRRLYERSVRRKASLGSVLEG